MMMQCRLYLKKISLLVSITLDQGSSATYLHINITALEVKLKKPVEGKESAVVETVLSTCSHDGETDLCLDL